VETTITKTDDQLLREYVQSKSADAFGELAARHTHWVYSGALRQVRDPHIAEDVAQAVFIILAQKAPKLAVNTVLNAWLFQVTRYASGHALRANARRTRHERMAATMLPETSNPNADSTWQQIQPSLDEMVGLLRHDDRQAILLRFYQQKSMADVGAALNVSEDAAKKRVAKALERLRHMLRGKGVAIPAAGLGVAMIAGTTQSAPAAVVASCSAGTAPPASVAAGLIARKTISAMFTAKIKFTAAAILLATLIPVAGIGAFLVYRQPDSRLTIAAATPAIVTPTEESLERDPGLADLQGTWKDTSLKQNGAEAEPKYRDGTLIIADHNLKYFNAQWQDVATISIDTSTTPSHIDFLEKGDTYRGLYVCDKDHLKICWGPGGGERPTEFATYPGDNRRLAEFQRVSNAAAAPATQPASAEEAENRARCAANLRKIGQVLFVFTTSHNGQFPPNFASLLQGAMITPDVFICPETGKSFPRNSSQKEQAEWISSNSDYEYLGEGLSVQTVSSIIVLAYDRDGNHHGDGANVLFGDGHVEFLSPAAEAEVLERNAQIRAGRQK
jgi:RNA polymerase sigma factor (sigma-70 family)